MTPVLGFEQFIEAADKHLYRAKQAGRNRSKQDARLAGPAAGAKVTGQLGEQAFPPSLAAGRLSHSLSIDVRPSSARPPSGAVGVGKLGRVASREHEVRSRLVDPRHDGAARSPVRHHAGLAAAPGDIDLVNRMRPDAVVLTGDYVCASSRPIRCSSAFGAWRCRRGGAGQP